MTDENQRNNEHEDDTENGNEGEETSEETEVEAEGTEGSDDDTSDGEEGADEGTEGDDEGSEEDEDPKDRQIRVLQEKVDRKTAEVERLKGKNGDDSSSGPDYDRLYLVASGVKDKEEQSEIIKASKRMGVSIEEAAEDEYVQAKLERMRKAKTTKRAVTRPSNGSAPVKRDVDWYIRNGKVPTDPKLQAERAERLAKISKEKA